MPITLALDPNNKTGLIDTLMNISNPAGANYGRYLSKSEVHLALSHDGLGTDCNSCFEGQCLRRAPTRQCVGGHELAGGV